MFRVKAHLPKLLGFLLVVGLTIVTVGFANSQQFSLAQSPAKISPQNNAKYQLAARVIQDLGIPARYNMHFDHLMGTLTGKGDDSQLYARFRKMFVREIGWQHFKDGYVARFAADFSEDELQELLNLSKQPLMKKLVQAEMKAYMDTSKQRFKMGFELWDNYSNGNINFPDK
ncbi:MAG: DUF2059 domain-containing protein [Pseudanabaenaceae cyanobacterium bins.39]|nr:DUF2059 domain-containing protein [Pseudanabaenaceae cyanobacterium bins.39]